MELRSSQFFETGQGVRWRGRRWQVLAEEEAGFLTLVGVDPINKDQIAKPLLELEHNALEPDVLPLPKGRHGHAFEIA